MFSAQKSAAPADGKLYVEDVFSTWLYTGNAANQQIVNGIDLSAKGGLVWIKKRSAAQNNYLVDTTRGVGRYLISNTTAAASSYNSGYIPDFRSDGFYTGNLLSDSGATYASWTFRKAPKFFDVVTYTGNGTAGRTISHNLGVTPGCIILKSTGNGGGWLVLHRYDFTKYMELNSTAAAAGPYTMTNATSTSFSLESAVNGNWNTNGDTYVAYLFAHDATSDGVIQCGSYTGTDATLSVNLGWEPQWILIKSASLSGTTYGNWHIVDNMRGLNDTLSSTSPPYLRANTTAAEATGNPNGISITSTGFKVSSAWSVAPETYIYIAIRRGPMKTPTLGTSVFLPVANSISPNTAYTTGFPVDWILTRKRASDGTYVGSRLTGNGTYLTTNTTNAEAAYTAWYFDKNTGTMASNIYSSAQSYIYWNFRRAPGFFDEVCYTGTGVARTLNHNLGVAPELMIVKRRNTTGEWVVYAAQVGNNRYLLLNATNGQSGVYSGTWNSTTPTSTVFSLGTDIDVNTSGGTYVAYLFASCPGVSKIGTYTGNGSSQTINCGFAAGARFVMIKRTDSTGDWYVWDTARGIVSGNDPHLSLNTTAAEVTTDDTIDTDSTGFVVNQVAATNVNVSSATYLYLAIS